MQIELRDLIKRLQPRIYRIGRSFRYPTHLIDDLYQEALLTWVAKASEIQDPEAWLIKTFKNRCIVHRRAQAAECRLLKEYTQRDRLNKENDAEWRRELLEMYLDLLRLVSCLPPKARKLLLMRLEGYSSDEIAVRLGYHSASVRKIKNRVRSNLARKVKLKAFWRGAPRDNPGNDLVLS